MTIHRKLLTFAILGLSAWGPQIAAADPAYKAADIVKHFAPPNLGEARGLCIGTESECAKAVAPPKAITNMAFDLVVNFDYNSDKLTPSAKQNLDEFAKALRNPRLS